MGRSTSRLSIVYTKSSYYSPVIAIGYDGNFLGIVAERKNALRLEAWGYTNKAHLRGLKDSSLRSSGFVRVATPF
ncbi:MAG: hypothetical protein ACR2LR_07645 [Hassallia sp.]